MLIFLFFLPLFLIKSSFLRKYIFLFLEHNYSYWSDAKSMTLLNRKALKISSRTLKELNQNRECEIKSLLSLRMKSMNRKSLVKSILLFVLLSLSVIMINEHGFSFWDMIKKPWQWAIMNTLTMKMNRECFFPMNLAYNEHLDSEQMLSIYYIFLQQLSFMAACYMEPWRLKIDSESKLLSRSCRLQLI